MRYRPEQHLRRQGEIKAVREQGRRIECGAFTFWWLDRHAAKAKASLTTAVSPAEEQAPASQTQPVPSGQESKLTMAEVGAPRVGQPQPATESELVRGPRVCVVASIAAVGKAVERVRAKRRLREVFRLHQDKLRPELDVMLVARASGNRMDFAELEQRFLQACTRIQGKGGSRA